MDLRKWFRPPQPRQSADLDTPATTTSTTVYESRAGAFSANASSGQPPKDLIRRHLCDDVLLVF